MRFVNRYLKGSYYWLKINGNFGYRSRDGREIIIWEMTEKYESLKKSKQIDIYVSTMIDLTTYQLVFNQIPVHLVFSF